MFELFVCIHDTSRCVAKPTLMGRKKCLHDGHPESWGETSNLGIIRGQSPGPREKCWILAFHEGNSWSQGVNVEVGHFIRKMPRTMGEMPRTMGKMPRTMGKMLKLDISSGKCPIPWGECPGPWGECPGPWGECPGPWGKCPGPWGECPGPWGECPGPWGECPGPWGKCPGPWGECPGPWGECPGPWGKCPGPWGKCWNWAFNEDNSGSQGETVEFWHFSRAIPRAKGKLLTWGFQWGESLGPRGCLSPLSTALVPPSPALTRTLVTHCLTNYWGL